jgi:hypothetical protein
MYNSKGQTQKFEYEMFPLFPTSYKDKIMLLISPKPPFWNDDKTHHII